MNVVFPVRFVLFYLSVLQIYPVCVVTSDGGLIFLYCFVTGVCDSPNKRNRLPYVGVVSF